MARKCNFTHRLAVGWVPEVTWDPHELRVARRRGALSCVSRSPSQRTYPGAYRGGGV